MRRLPAHDRPTSSDIVRLANQYETPLVGRGAGTGLSGGALARDGGIVVAFSRMNRILEMDAENRRAVVQPGVVNLDLTRAVEHLGLYFAPDPVQPEVLHDRRQRLGKFRRPAHAGLRRDHESRHRARTRAARWPKSCASAARAAETPGYDLTGLFVGSEGTLALVTEITVRLLRKPEAVKTLLAVFDARGRRHRNRGGNHARAASLPPRAKCSTAGRCAPSKISCTPDFRADSAAVLLLEVEGSPKPSKRRRRKSPRFAALHHAREVRVARDDRERDLLWKGRKNAFGAIGRLSPTYYVQDGVIPRTKLPRRCAASRRSAKSTASRSAIFFTRATAIFTR